MSVKIRYLRSYITPSYFYIPMIKKESGVGGLSFYKLTHNQIYVNSDGTYTTDGVTNSLSWCIIKIIYEDGTIIYDETESFLKLNTWEPYDYPTTYRIFNNIKTGKYTFKILWAYGINNDIEPETSFDVEVVDGQTTRFNLIMPVVLLRAEISYDKFGRGNVGTLDSVDPVYDPSELKVEEAGVGKTTAKISIGDKILQKLEQIPVLNWSLGIPLPYGRTNNFPRVSASASYDSLSAVWGPYRSHTIKLGRGKLINPNNVGFSTEGWTPDPTSPNLVGYSECEGYDYYYENNHIAYHYFGSLPIGAISRFLCSDYNYWKYEPDDSGFPISTYALINGKSKRTFGAVYINDVIPMNPSTNMKSVDVFNKYMIDVFGDEPYITGQFLSDKYEDNFPKKRLMVYRTTTDELSDVVMLSYNQAAASLPRGPKLVYNNTDFTDYWYNGDYTVGWTYGLLFGYYVTDELAEEIVKQINQSQTRYRYEYHRE